MPQVQTNEWVHSGFRRKRDVFLATSVLPLVAPLGTTGLLLSRLVDGHSPLFGQERVGKHDELFTIRKIRTMPNCSENTPSEGTLDNRASKLGRLLRLTAIDEIPQVYNILSGDLSLIGPRALIEDEIKDMQAMLEPELFNPWYNVYTTAGPGCISSFGHDSHASERELAASYRRRAESDLVDYQNASPLNDMRLLIRVGQTVAKVAMRVTG